MYTPDHGFVSKLKDLDPKLGCHFQAPNVIVTYKRATGEPVPIYTVATDDGGFRIPDQRDINALHEGDLSKEDTKTRFDRTSKYMAKHRADHKRKTHDDIQDATKDNKVQLARQMAKARGDAGKHRAYRQAIPKPKGKVFE